MTIHKERTHDMSGWVAQKADKSLQAACRLVDWFKGKVPQLSDEEVEEARDLLFSLLYDLSKLSDFGHGERRVWSREWVDVMLDGGTDRFREFQSRLESDISPKSPPSELPLPVIDVLRLLQLLESKVHSEADRGFVRGEVLAAAKKLQQSEFAAGREAGQHLSDLVEDQAVNVLISWDEFVAAARQVFVECRKRITREIQVPRWST